MGEIANQVPCGCYIADMWVATTWYVSCKQSYCLLEVSYLTSSGSMS